MELTSDTDTLQEDGLLGALGGPSRQRFLSRGLEIIWGDVEDIPARRRGRRWDTRCSLKPFPLQDSPQQLWSKTTGAKLIGGKVILN